MCLVQTSSSVENEELFEEAHLPQHFFLGGDRRQNPQTQATSRSFPPLSHLRREREDKQQRGTSSALSRRTRRRRRTRAFDPLASTSSQDDLGKDASEDNIQEGSFSLDLHVSDPADEGGSLSSAALRRNPKHNRKNQRFPAAVFFRKYGHCFLVFCSVSSLLSVLFVYCLSPLNFLGGWLNFAPELFSSLFSTRIISALSLPCWS